MHRWSVANPCAVRRRTRFVQFTTVRSSAMNDSFRAADERSAAIEPRIATHPEEFRMLTGDRPTGRAPHRALLRLDRQPAPPPGVRRRDPGAGRRLPGDHRPRGRRRHPRQRSQPARSTTWRPGIDPERATIFTHSAVPALNQLLLPFLSLVSVAELQRNPTVKDEAASRGHHVDQRPDADLPGAPGRGHPVLQGQRGAGRQGPAAAHRADPGGGTPLQRAVRRRPSPSRARCSRRPPTCSAPTAPR